MSERIKASQAAGVLGVSKRLVTLMASRGQLPGAAKIGSLWTFDLEKLKKWVEEQEKKCQKTTQTETLSFATASTTCEPALRVKLSKSRYEQAMSLLRARAETKPSQKLKNGPSATIVPLRGGMR